MVTTYAANTATTYGSGSIEAATPAGTGGVRLVVCAGRNTAMSPADASTDDYGTAVLDVTGGEMRIQVFAVDDTGNVDETFNRGGGSEFGVFSFRIDDATAAADVVAQGIGPSFNTSETPPAIPNADIDDSDFVVVTVMTSNQGDSVTATSGNTGDTDFVEHHDADVGGSGWWAGQAHVCSWSVSGHTTTSDYAPSAITSSDPGGVRTVATILVPVSSGGTDGTASPAAISTTTTVSATASGEQSATASPAAVTTTTTLGATATGGTGATASPAAITTTTTVGATASGGTGATASPAAVTTTTTVDAPASGGTGATASPAAITTTTTVAAAASGGANATAQPAAISTSTAVAATASGEQSATASPTAITTTTTLGATASASGDATASPAAITTTTTVGATADGEVSAIASPVAITTTVTISAVASSAEATFLYTPPTRGGATPLPPENLTQKRANRNRLFRRLTPVEIGQTVLLNGSTYTVHPSPTAREVADADTAYLGGHVYTVTLSEKTAIEASGVGGTFEAA